MKRLVALVFVAALLLGCTQPSPGGYTCPGGQVVSNSSSCPIPTVVATATPTPAPARTQTPAPTPTQAPVITPTPAPTPTPGRLMQRGTADPAFEVVVYDENRSCFGTTIFPDNHNASSPRVVEVNMLGEIIWKFDLPPEWRDYTNPGFDVEPLSGGNVLMVLPRKGVYEINRNGSVVWSFVDAKVSHDADRLPNGNTLIAFGASDTKSDAQAREVTPDGRVVWSYHAGDYFGTNPAYKDINSEGWTHTNALTRLANGSTVVSHRNFNLLSVVDASGHLTGTIESEYFEAQHDPAYLANGDLLFATHTTPQRAIELDANGGMVWNFTMPERNSWPVRDANRLPNGNTLITCADRIVEVTPDGVVAWAFKLTGTPFSSQMDNAARGFYKAERLEST